jgi:hypothetical protein
MRCRRQVAAWASSAAPGSCPASGQGGPLDRLSEAAESAPDCFLRRPHGGLCPALGGRERAVIGNELPKSRDRLRDFGSFGDRGSRPRCHESRNQADPRGHERTRRSSNSSSGVHQRTREPPSNPGHFTTSGQVHFRPARSAAAPSDSQRRPARLLDRQRSLPQVRLHFADARAPPRVYRPFAGFARVFSSMEGKWNEGSLRKLALSKSKNPIGFPDRQSAASAVGTTHGPGPCVSHAPATEWCEFLLHA